MQRLQGDYGLGRCVAVEQQIHPLRSPEFPVESLGFGKVRASLFAESRIRGRCWVQRSRKSGSALSKKHGRATLVLTDNGTRVPHIPGFPVDLGGANRLHAAFREENRTRGCRSEPLAGNPGISLLRCGSTPALNLGLRGTHVSKARRGAPNLPYRVRGETSFIPLRWAIGP